MCVLELILSVLALQLSSADRPPPAPPRSAIVIVSGVDRAFDWAKPVRPEPWWPVGARLLRYFDHDVVLARGRDLPDLVSRLEAELRERRLASIRRVEIWSHGNPGTFRIQRQNLGREIFSTSDEKLLAALQTLRSRLAGGAVIHFRSCRTFHGRAGRAFAEAASRFFNVTGKGVIVMGHTRPTGLIHPGWRTLLPARRASWSDREGMLEAPLENAEILVRDLVWIGSGGAAECVPYLMERWLPALRERVESWVVAALVSFWGTDHEMPGLQVARPDAATHRGRGR